MLEKMLLPLAAFEPDLVVICAGFDAHAHDPLEAGGLHEVDYEWMTQELVGIAETHCEGRVVSVLEGGYSPAVLRRCVGAHVKALMGLASASAIAAARARCACERRGGGGDVRRAESREDRPPRSFGWCAALRAGGIRPDTDGEMRGPTRCSTM